MNLRYPMKPSRPVSLQPDPVMTADSDGLSAAEIASAVSGRKVSALSVTEAALARIAKHDSVLNAFTDVTADRARAKARSIDAAIAAGKNAGLMPGGCSGGSGGAVGGNLVPLALGSDTNGSIRVPSSFCGIFGLKPTYGRLSRARSLPFVFSFDHLGPFARNVEDLALAYDAMQGSDPDDAACTTRPAEPVSALLAQDIDGLRIAIAGGYFQKNVFPEAIEAVARVAKALDAARTVEIPEAARARAAAYVITTSEGASLHLDRLRRRPNDFDPAVRDRLLAGAMVPAPLVDRAQKFRRWYRAQMLELFKSVDVIIAPATPGVAPKLGQGTFVLDGVEQQVRANN